jgi:hypothetical protein
MYSWVGEGRFEDGGLFELVRHGALSTGAFASFLAVVFRDDAAMFAYKGETTDGGQRLAEFEFHVPVQSSHYIFNGGGGRVTTGYFGSILVDPATADLVRMVVQTEGLPVETGACESRSTLSYSRVRLNDADFLLPSRVDLHILNSDGVELENVTAYSGCHEFLGESKLSFDDPQEPGAPAASRAAKDAEELPGGLPFTIQLTSIINPASAAAGDKIGAQLTTPIQDASGRAIAPAGATVNARIIQIRRFYVPSPMVRLVIKLETVTIAGAPWRLNAVSEFWSVDGFPIRKGFQRGYDSVAPDNQDPAAAVFEIRKPKGDLIPAFESKWTTAPRKP